MALCFVLMVFLLPLITADILGDNKPCGGQLDATNGSIVISDNIGKVDEKCVWVIKNTKKVYQMSIHISSDSVINNLLNVYDGTFNASLKTENLLFNFTEKSSPVWMVALSSMTTIVFTRKTMDKGGNNITIDYNTDNCSHTMTTGEITPPIYLPGRGGLVCYYNITQMLNTEYHGILSFLTFNLPDGNLIIGNKAYKGEDLPGDVLYDNPASLNMKLTIENSTQVQTFTGIISQVIASCSGQFDVNITQEYTIPIPSLHPLVTECRLIFTTANKRPLMVELVEVKLLGADRLVMADGASQGDRSLLNGAATATGTRVLTKGDNLWVRLVVDTLPGKRMVQLRISETVSGGRFYDQGKITLGVASTIEVGNGLSDYYYQLVAPEQVEVTLTQSNISGAIEFYDGFHTTLKPIAVFNTLTRFYPVTSSGANLLIIARNFSTEKVVANFVSVIDSCNVDTSESKGSYSIKQLNEKQTCQWTISSETPDTIISLKFQTVYLRVNDTLTINAISSQSTILAKFVGPTELSFIPQINVASGFVTQVIFSTTTNCTESNCSQPLIEADYSSSKVCVGNLLHPSGVITSPSWPNVYPLNAACIWSDDEAPTSDYRMLYISFNKFDLRNNHSLSIASSLNKTKQTDIKLTGVGLHKDIIAKGDNFQFIFSSAQQKSNLKTEVGQGFQASYRFLDCGGEVVSFSSVIHSPGYPQPYNKSDVCVWIIQLPLKKDTNKTVDVIQVELQVNFKTSMKNNESLLEIHDGSSVHDPVIVLNATSNATSFMSRTDMLLIVYNTTKAPNLTFNLNYTTYKCNEFCANNVCLHPSWRCNGIDECGDNTDEQNCVFPYPQTTTPSPSKGSGSGVSGYWVAVTLLFGILMGVLAAIFIPHIYKRVRFPNYSHLRESNNPIA